MNYVHDIVVDLTQTKSTCKFNFRDYFIFSLIIFKHHYQQGCMFEVYGPKGSAICFLGHYQSVRFKIVRVLYKW